MHQAMSLSISLHLVATVHCLCSLICQMIRQVSVRTWAVLHHRLRLAEKTPQEAATAILLRGLMELCIYGAAPASRGRASDGGSDRDGEHLPVPWSCADNALLQVRTRK